MGHPGRWKDRKFKLEMNSRTERNTDGQTERQTDIQMTDMRTYGTFLNVQQLRN